MLGTALIATKGYTAAEIERVYSRARQLLAEVYGNFTEGFTTTDLQEAHALLQQLED